MDQELAKEVALRERETRQLRRLEVFMDVIFAVVLSIHHPCRVKF